MTEITNKNLDTTPLPPNNLVAKDPQSAELARYVRSKSKLADMRESIARSIELNSTRSKSAEILAQETLQVTKTATSNMANQVELIRAEKDAVIANVTVDSEVILARGGKATLGQRLDEATEQLAHIANDMSSLVGDGLADDSIAIQNIINQATLNKVKKITFPKATYRMNNIVIIEGDDIDIDFSGSTILSYAKATENIWGEDALFSPRGKLVEGNSLLYLRDSSTLPSATPEMIYFENVRDSNVDGRIKTTDNSYYSVGDEVMIRGWTRPTGAPYSTELFEPTINTVAKVISKDVEYIYVDFRSPFKYQEFVFNENFKSAVSKVEMLKNFTLKNATFIDMTDFSGDGNAPNSNEVSESISMVAPYLVDGLTLENIHVRDHRMNAINPFYCRNIKINNVSATNARIWNGGKGYLTQIRGSRDIIVDKAYGDGCRHVVDLSFSCYAKVYNAEGVNSRSADLDLHGICEHDVEFINCKGLVTMGNGLDQFPNIVKNVKFKDCDVRFMAKHTLESWVEDVEFIDCKITLTDWFDYVRTKFVNCEILYSNRLGNYAINKRNLNIESKFEMKDCTLTFSKEISNFVLFWRNYDELNIDGLEFQFEDGVSLPSYGLRIELLALRNVTLKHIKGAEINFRYRSSGGDKLLKFEDSDIEYNLSQGYFLNVESLTDSRLLVDISKNNVIHNGSNKQYFGFESRDVSNFVNSSLIGKIEGNTFIGNPNAYVRLTYSAHASIHDTGNVVDYRSTSASNMWSDEGNLILNKQI